MKRLYRLRDKRGQGIFFEGVFVHEEKDFVESIGKEVGLWKISGKYDGKYLTITENNIQDLTGDQYFIELFEELNLATGIDPIKLYLERDLEED